MLGRLNPFARISSICFSFLLFLSSKVCIWDPSFVWNPFQVLYSFVKSVSAIILPGVFSGILLETCRTSHSIPLSGVKRQAFSVFFSDSPFCFVLVRDISLFFFLG